MNLKISFKTLVFFLFLSNSCGKESGVLLYRLGDMVKGGIHRSNAGGEAYHKANYPDSLAVAYMNSTTKSNDYDILFNLIEKQEWKSKISKYNFDFDHTLFIHLRVGDVLEQSPSTVAEHLDRHINYLNGIQYVRPLSFYAKIQQELPTNVTKVILVTGFHTPEKSTNKSLKYIRKINAFFKEKGYTTSEPLIDNPPDEDFILMSNANFFVKSGGGYSHLIGKMVEKRAAGTVYQ